MIYFVVSILFPNFVLFGKGNQIDNDMKTIHHLPLNSVASALFHEVPGNDNVFVFLLNGLPFIYAYETELLRTKFTIDDEGRRIPRNFEVTLCFVNDDRSMGDYLSTVYLNRSIRTEQGRNAICTYIWYTSPGALNASYHNPMN